MLKEVFKKNTWPGFEAVEFILNSGYMTFEYADIIKKFIKYCEDMDMTFLDDYKRATEWIKDFNSR